MKESGRYDYMCEEVLRKTDAHTVLLMIASGNKGHGFSVATVDPTIHPNIPKLLREIASAIEKEDSCEFRKEEGCEGNGTADN